MISTTVVANIFSRSRATHRYLDHASSARVEQLVPSDWAHLRESLVPMVGGKKASWQDEVQDGGEVVFLVAPRGIEQIFLYVFIMFASSVILRSLAPKPPKQVEDNSSPVYGYQGIAPSRVEGDPIPLYYGRLRVGGQIINEFVDDFGALGAQYNALVSLGEGPLEQVAGQTSDTVAPLSSDGVPVIPFGQVYVNDTDAANLQGVEVDVRLGSLEQTSIDGFETATTTVTVDTELAGPTTANATTSAAVLQYANPTLLLNGTSSSSTWTASGIVYTTTSAHEGVVLKIQLPEGLGEIQGSGAILAGYTGINVRYRELDGSGNPITTSPVGTDGDGYVRLRTFRYYARFNAGVAYDIRIPFYDPQTFVRNPLAQYADFNSGGGMTATSSGSPWTATLDRVALERNGTLTVPSQGPEWSSSGSAQSFTVELFLYPRRLGSTTSNNTNGGGDFTVTLAQNIDTNWVNLNSGGTTTTGFRIGCRQVSFQIAAGQNVNRCIPSVQLGTTFFHEDNTGIRDATYVVPYVQTGANNVVIGGGQVPSGSWVSGTSLTAGNFDAQNAFWGWQHIVAVYQRDSSPGRNRIRLYANGVKLFDYTTTVGVTLPSFSSARLQLGASDFQGRMSNVAVYKGAMAESDILLQYNNGQHRTFVYPDLYPVAFYKFAAGAQLNDSSGNSNTLAQVDINSPNVRDVSFRTNIATTASDTNGVATIKKARYRIEVMRGFLNSTNTQMLDTQRWASARLVDFQPYQYPTAPLLAVSVRATSEINGSLPRVTSLVKGRKVPVWDRASIDQPTFDLTYSNNPAWVLCDIALNNKQWGLGSVFESADLDMVSIGDWADYCDEIIYNQSGYTAPYNATTTGTARTWYDIDYAFDFTYQTNALYLRCPSGSVPASVRVGDFLGLYGLPVVPGFADINNTSTTGGYEIIKVLGPTASPFYDIVAVRYTGSAPWTLNQLLSAQGVTLAGTAQTRDYRFRFDGAIDQQQPAWDAILTVCSSARAVPIRDGKRLRVAVYRPRPVVNLISSAQVVAGTFEVEYLSPRTKFNQIEIGFLDKELNYERSMVSTEHISVRGTTDSTLLRRRSFFQEGVVTRPQIMRQAAFLLNQEHEVRRRGRFTGSIDLLGLEPLDVVRISHELLDRGLSGRTTANSALATQVYVDREVTLQPAVTYKLSYRSANAPAGSLPEERTVTTASGTYAVGSSIAVSSAFSVLPEKGDIWTLYPDGEDLLAQIDSISLTSDLQREVEWSEYVDAVYDIEDPGDIPDVGAEFLTGSSPSRGSSSTPTQVTSVLVREEVARGPGGAHQPRLLVTWTTENTSQQVAGFDVYLSPDQGTGRYYEKRATTGAGERSCVLMLDEGDLGSTYVVSVVARSQSGAALRPELGKLASVRLIGRGPAPAAVSWDATPASLDGEGAVYRIVRTNLDDSSTVEIRRGGWLLGSRIGSLPQGTGKLGPTANFCMAVSSSLHATSHLHGIMPGNAHLARAVSERGKYSAAATYAWSPVFVEAEVPVQTANRTFFSNCWEDFGIGWRRSGAATPNATLTGCQVTTSTLFPRGYLEFSGTNLSATYTTPDSLIEVDQRAEWFYNSATVIAEQIWPQTWAEDTSAWGDDEGQMTWEGPLVQLPAALDVGRVTLRIEFRLYDGEGSYSDWTEYTPGKVRCVHAQWRLVMTRPSVNHQVRVYGFATQLLRIPRQRFERSGLQYFAEHQIFGRT